MKSIISKSILLGLVMLAAMFSFSLDSRALALNASPMQITATYPDFSDLSQFTLNRNTLTSNPNQTGAQADDHHVLRLVPAKGYQSGSAFLTKRVSLANQRSFSTYFSFQITDSFASGADGIVFTVQTLANNVGSFGGGIGYAGITPSMGVEFDTWNNPGTDPNDNHVGLDVNGTITSIATAEPPGQLDSGQIWHAWIDYDGQSKLLEVRMATDSARPNQPILSKTIDLKKILNMDEVYVGFTSATGSAWANHDIRSFYFYNDYGPIDTSSNTYSQAATQVTVAASPTATYDQSTISAVVLDARNTPLGAQPVTFTTNLGTIIGTAVTDANGVATTTLSKTPQTITGTATVKAVAPGGAYGQVDVEFLGEPNVAPAFTKGPDQLVNKQQVTSHTVTGWATDISAGPSNESHQHLHFVVSNSDNSLFTDQPALSPEGTLTYTPAPGANGVAVVSVRLQDDGGTAQGGQDTSPEQTFEIVIDTLDPAIGNITQNVAHWTNQPVVVRTDFDGTGTAIVSKKYASSERTIGYFANNGIDLSNDNSLVAHASGIYTIYARDAAGNETATTYHVQNIDTVPPVTMVELPPHDGSNEWYSSTVRLNWKSEDDQSGVSKTQIRINGGDWINVTDEGYIFTEDGNYSVEYRSIDQAGNVEDTKTTTFKIDQTPPSLKITVDNATLWPPNHKMVPIHVTVEAADTMSGLQTVVLNSITYNEPNDGSGDGHTSNDIQGAEFGTTDTDFYVRAERSGEGEDRVYTVTYTATDKAGHVTAATATITVPHDQSQKKNK